MPLRRRLLLLAPGLALALAAGCADADERGPGDPVTAEEAEVLAGLLERNREEAGAAFTVTAPYAEDTVLALTGEVDFTAGRGRAQAVTRGGERPEETRTLFFTHDRIWFGDVPGLAEALGAAGLPEAAYVRRPVAAGEQAPLTDVLVQVVLNLAAEEADDPAAFRVEGYTWEGERSIDRKLVTVYGSPSGWTVAVDSSDRLVQYVTRLPGQDFAVTVTLSDHGPRDIPLPPAVQSVDGTAHPQVAAAVGL